MASHAQNKIIDQPQSERSIATVHSNDWPQGSRVTISSNESLIDYEAYRQGDKFYLRIPVAEAPRVDRLRGRSFTAVTAAKNGDRMLLCFTLQPGATAHVEQSGNRLDVVIALPGAGTFIVPANSQTTVPPFIRTDIPRLRNSSADANRRKPQQAMASTATEPGKTGPLPVAPKPSVTPAQRLSTPTPANSSSTPVAPSSPSQDWWSRMKERTHYWILLAQLNPIPVALGAALLLLIVGLLLFQRRRARATRRARPVKSNSTQASTVEAAATGVAPAAATTAAKEPVSGPPAAEEKVDDASAIHPVVPVPVSAPAAGPSDNGRQERVSRASEEARKLFSGEAYDESVVGSYDREMRRVVGAELTTALVGRNAEKRERAREAFMKYGYFDDATRDLRTANSENERAAAARRLSFVQDRAATPHLIGALGDTSPDVRRAAVEALMDSRDPAAIAPLNSLLQTETDGKVPRNLISQAIEACATVAPASAAPGISYTTSSAVPDFVPSVPQTASPTFETEREVIEL